GATEGRHFPHPRLSAGERDSACSRAGQAGDQGSPDHAVGRVGYRTSQRLGSSSTALLSVTQALAEKKQTATDFSRWSVTIKASRLSLTSPRTNATFLMSKPRPIRLLNDCCSCAWDACAAQTSVAAIANDLIMSPPR